MCEQGDTVPIHANGSVRDVDRCIAAIVIALNQNGIATIACCCGHGVRPGNIALADGRELIVARNFSEGRLIDAAFHGVN